MNDIDKKDEQLKILREALEFYADIKNYHTNFLKMVTRDSECNMIKYEDLEKIIANDGSYEKLFGGKRAREALKKLGEMNNEK